MNFIFRIGVILAIYNFIWWFVTLMFKLILNNKNKNVFEVYFTKFIKYALLVDIVFLFCFHVENHQELLLNITMAGLILLIYFIGKLQNKQNTNSFLFSISGSSNYNLNNFMKSITPIFNKHFEIGVIVLSLSLFGVFYSAPDWASNPISTWFYESILNIENTPIFGFIFKVIGFFFLISVLSKISNGLILTAMGRKRKGSNENSTREDDHFDDYTEIK